MCGGVSTGSVGRVVGGKGCASPPIHSANAGQGLPHEEDAVAGVGWRGAWGGEGRGERGVSSHLVDRVVAGKGFADKEDEVGSVDVHKLRERAHQRLVVLSKGCLHWGSDRYRHQRLIIPREGAIETDMG